MFSFLLMVTEALLRSYIATSLRIVFRYDGEQARIVSEWEKAWPLVALSARTVMTEPVNECTTKLFHSKFLENGSYGWGIQNNQIACKIGCILFRL